MARAKNEQRQPAGAMTLTAWGGLVVAFLLCMAILNAVKGGSLPSETDLLLAALTLYAAAGAFYLGFGATGTEYYVKLASMATWLGFIANSAALALRWYDAGRPPFATVYEMLLSSVWMLALLTLIADKRFGVKVIATVTMPVAIVGMVLMLFLRTAPHPLVPLLQSTWLSVHVTLAILAYAACALSFALAMMFLIQDQMKTETILALSSASTLAIYAATVLTCFERWSGLSLNMWGSNQESEILLFQSVRLSISIAVLGWLMVAALVVVGAPLACYFLARWTNDKRFLNLAHRGVVASIFLQAITLAVLLVRVDDGRPAAPAIDGSFPFQLAANPFIVAGLAAGVFISLLFLLLVWRRQDLERLLPGADALDRLTYRTICFAFPLLTLTIATGAYWANRTWGSYWSWDPKETWAAITWLVYALYFHMRVTVGWRGRRAAYFVIAGFAVVIFTFFGVTYMFHGRHAFD